MRRRCNSPSAHNYKWYGGKGVRVEWEDFESFQKWALGNGYREGLQIDRIDSNGNYSPENCWWIARSDNILRSHLVLGGDLDRDAVAYCKEADITMTELINRALVGYLNGSRGGEGQCP